MTVHTQERRDRGFAIGLLTGTFVGVGLGIWLGPRLVLEARERVTGSARGIRLRASEQFQQASARVGEAVNDLSSKGLHLRDDVADAVARGAHDVERYAVAAKSDGPIIEGFQK